MGTNGVGNGFLVSMSGVGNGFSVSMRGVDKWVQVVLEMGFQ